MTDHDPMVRIVQSFTRSSDYPYLKDYFSNKRADLINTLVYGDLDDVGLAQFRGMIQGIDLFLNLKNEYLGEE